MEKSPIATSQMILTLFFKRLFPAFTAAFFFSACSILPSKEIRIMNAIQTGDTLTARPLIENAHNLNFITESDTFPLLEAAEAGNLKLVQLLTGYRADINLQNSKGLTALMAAIDADHPDIAEYLILEGADLSLKNHRQYTALHFAVDRGNQKYIDILMDRTAPEAYTGADAVSLLVPAIENNDIDTVSYLLAKKISPTPPPGQGLSPLTTAAVSPNPEIIDLLLKHGADARAKDPDGCDALWLLGSVDKPFIMEKIYTLADPLFFKANPTGRVESKSTKTKIGLKSLLKALDSAVDSSDPMVRKTKTRQLMETYDYSFLFTTVSEDQIQTISQTLKSDYADIVEQLLTAGADINTTDKRGRTILNLVCGRKEKDIETLFSNPEFALPPDALERLSLISARAETIHAALIKPFLAGSDLNQADEYGNTPLLLACAGSLDSLALMLIQEGAAVNAANKDGWTPLIQAAAARKYAVAELLLTKGADVNAANAFGETALLKAVHNNDAPMVKILISHGADPRKANKLGDTPLNAAQKIGNQEMMTLLREAP